VITSRSVEEFFSDALQSALQDQQTSASRDAVDYVVNVLTVFSRSDRLYEHTDDGYGLKPLAMIYADAVYSRDPTQRADALKRLGDVALFLSGLFAHSFNRKLVDVEYCMAMGGSAYSALSTAQGTATRAGCSADTFAELADKFGRFADALAEVSRDASFNNDSDLLRTYDMWLRTGSRRAASVLRRAGIAPGAFNGRRVRH
jgi:hypothetical protein